MSLIINKAHEAPKFHHHHVRGKLKKVEGRRPASYDIFDPINNTQRTEPLDRVNAIRTRVDQWRQDGWPGVTIVTRELLEHWYDSDARSTALYFCQVEAIETLIWWVESTDAYKQGIEIPGDGGPWERLCNKMATGTGKTIVMGMIITWQVLNALTYPKRNKDFSRGILVVAPGLTVKERLRVLIPSEGSCYDEFNLCPSEAMRQKLNQAEVWVENWHALMPMKDAKRSIVKKGRESDEAFARRVLDRLADYKDIVVINDEAHHAYRKPPELKISKKRANEQGIDLDEATRWIEGLDRIHKTRRIQRCFDLSATPFAPTGKKNVDMALFGWIVSDFGLNDAIEAGLVKTPRVVVRDGAHPDTETLRPKLYHIYRDPEVSEDLNRSSAKPDETLPELVQSAYTILGADWVSTSRQWKELNHPSPPVMLTVCNRTETAARIENYFNSGSALWADLHAPNKTLRVDSKVLGRAEIGENSAIDKDYESRLRAIINAADIPESRRKHLLGKKKEELLREIVDSVGKRASAGQGLQNVISVAMLSEGWDAKNVTHIMGLRAFSSQLLCEQVVGRGLRRVSYDKDENGLFYPEYVNIFGVPLSISESEEGGEPPAPPKPATQIEVVPERSRFEITWPNVLRVETVVTPQLNIDWEAVKPLEIDPNSTRINVDIASALGGATDLTKVTRIQLEKLSKEFRLQRLIFLAAKETFLESRISFSGSTGYLAMQMVKMVEQFLESNLVNMPLLFESDEIRRQILIAMNMNDVVNHVLTYVTEQSTERLILVFNDDNPIGMTGKMRTWHTTKPCEPTTKSHISHMVQDSKWEGTAANILETNAHVHSYAKNDHLDFHIQYLWRGSRRRYFPDFLVRLSNGSTLVLEIKGMDSSRDREKRAALDEWIRAINTFGRFGRWTWDVAFDPNAVQGIILNHAGISE